MNDQSIYSLPQREMTKEEGIFGEGDALIIIRKNGDIVPMSIGVDVEKVNAISAKAPEDLTDDDKDVLLQGQMLFLLVMAAKSELLMNILATLANQSQQVTTESLTAAMRLH